MFSHGFTLAPQVMSNGLTQGQHHLGQVQAGHHVMYQNVQATQQSVSHHQQNQAISKQNHHDGGGGSGRGRGGGGGGHSNHHSSQQDVGRGGKKKKHKVNKDGVPQPKRSTTSYIIFTQWYREEQKRSGRTLPKFGDFGKECASKWNSMDEESKKPFLDTAARDRDRYLREMSIYKPPRDANKPKRPRTTFMLFLCDFRKEMANNKPEGGVSALAKLGGERWRQMSDEEKRPYVERHNEEKVRYEAIMEEYRRKSANQPGSSKQRLSTEGSEVASGGESDSTGANEQLASARRAGPDPLAQAAAALNFDHPSYSQASGQAQYAAGPSRQRLAYNWQ